MTESPNSSGLPGHTEFKNSHVWLGALEMGALLAMVPLSARLGNPVARTAALLGGGLAIGAAGETWKQYLERRDAQSNRSETGPPGR